MKKQSKKTKLQVEKVDFEKLYHFSEAIDLLKEFKSSKFVMRQYLQVSFK